VVEDAGAHVSHQVAPARVNGAGRNRRAAAEAIRSPERGDGGDREVARAGLGRFDRPRPEPAGLAQPGGLGGPPGLLGQQASGPEG
jgi:hypothetical protein